MTHALEHKDEVGARYRSRRYRVDHVYGRYFIVRNQTDEVIGSTHERESAIHICKRLNKRGD